MTRSQNWWRVIDAIRKLYKIPKSCRTKAGFPGRPSGTENVKPDMCLAEWTGQKDPSGAVLGLSAHGYIVIEGMPVGRHGLGSHSSKTIHMPRSHF